MFKLNNIRKVISILIVFILMSILVVPVFASDTLYENSGTGIFEFTEYGTTFLAQTFTPTVTHKITSAAIRIYKDGSPGTVTVSIRRTDINGKPTGADLCSGSLADTSIPAVPDWAEFIFTSPAILDANSKYAIVCSVPDGSMGNDINWKYQTGNAYAGGSEYSSVDSGATWLNDIAGADLDFREYGLAYTYPSSGIVMAQGLIPIIAVGVLLTMSIGAIAIGLTVAGLLMLAVTIIVGVIYLYPIAISLISLG